MTSHREDLPRRRPASDDDEDRPRRRPWKRKRASGTPPWVAVLAGGISFVVFGIAGYFVVRAALGPAEKPLEASGETGQHVADAVTGKRPADGGSSTMGGTGYVSRVSEKKFQEFVKGLTDEEVKNITDAQVFAVMGQPTRRGTPVTGRKNGQVLTVYTAYWEVPGSGISSQIVFANGRLNGMILGLETTPREPRGERN